MYATGICLHALATINALYWIILSQEVCALPLLGANLLVVMHVRGGALYIIRRGTNETHTYNDDV
jgi:hypothetical protein